MADPGACAPPTTTNRKSDRPEICHHTRRAGTAAYPRPDPLNATEAAEAPGGRATDADHPNGRTTAAKEGRRPNFDQQ